MTIARWKGVVLADSQDCEVVEGNYYFPRASVKFAYLEPSTAQSVCAWKGAAGYYDVVVDGERNKDAAWTYRSPKKAAEKIRDYLAFWKGVEVGE